MKYFFLFLALLSAQLSSASTDGDKDTVHFDARRFTIVMESMQPLSFPSKLLTDEYFIRVSGDSLYCRLPYVGRVYQPSFDSEGLTFETPLRAWKQTDMKKGRKKVEFRVARGYVHYEFSLIVWKDGSAVLNLRPSNAQGISYNGRVDY